MGLLDEELIENKNTEQEYRENNSIKTTINIRFDDILDEIAPPRDIGDFFVRQQKEIIPSVINGKLNFLTTDRQDLGNKIFENLEVIEGQLSLLDEKFVSSKKLTLFDDILVEELNHDEFILEYGNFHTIPDLIFFSEAVKNRQEILISDFEERKEDIEKIRILNDEIDEFVNSLVDIQRFAKIYISIHQ